MSRRRVTIDDVAKLAGVSYQTVSRVINNKPNVRESTRQRVQKIVADTGYRPSSIARPHARQPLASSSPTSLILISQPLLAELNKSRTPTDTACSYATPAKTPHVS